MSVFMVFRIALKALGRNKLRTALTMLGMIIGVGAVITMVALGTGAQAAIEEQIKATGTNTITIMSGNFTSGAVRMGEGNSSRLMATDAQALRALPQVQWVAEGASTRQQLIAGNQNWNTQIQGTNVDWPLIKAWPLKYGQFFTEQDVQSAAKVVVLGSNVSEILYGADVDPVGQNVRVRNHVFRIVGVFTAKGASSGGQNQDDQAFVPFTTVQKKIQGIQHINNITVSAVSAESIVAARKTAGPFKSLFDFCERVDSSSCNRSTVETLIKALGGADLTGAVLDGARLEDPAGSDSPPAAADSPPGTEGGGSDPVRSLA